MVKRNVKSPMPAPLSADNKGRTHRSAPGVVQGTKPKAYAGLPRPSTSISLTANPFSTRHSTTLICGLTYSSFCMVFKYFF